MAAVRSLCCLFARKIVTQSVFSKNSPHDQRIFLRNISPLGLTSIRFKSGKNQRSQQPDEDDDSDSDDEGIPVGRGTEVKTVSVQSMRADLILKIGLGLSRKTVQEAFYESRIRVNSKKIFKKSAAVREGDEVDLIKGESPENPKFLLVGRVEVISAKAREETEDIRVKLRRSKSLVVDNYPEGDPWVRSDNAVENSPS